MPVRQNACVRARGSHAFDELKRMPGDTAAINVVHLYIADIQIAGVAFLDRAVEVEYGVLVVAVLNLFYVSLPKLRIGVDGAFGIDLHGHDRVVDRQRQGGEDAVAVARADVFQRFYAGK